MNKLYEVIKDALKEVVDNVYFEEAEENATFPYVVFRAPVSNKNYRRDDVIIEVDVWHNGTLITTENIADLVSAKLNRFYHFEKGIIQISMYEINRFRVPDPDVSIKRRQLRFRCDTYFPE